MSFLQVGWRVYSGLILCLLLLIGGVWYLSQETAEPVAEEPLPAPVTIEPVAEPLIEEAVIGASVEGRAIRATTIRPLTESDTETRHLLLVGGIHGGYEWNSALLAYEMIDYYTKNQALLPSNVTITIIPDLNPDATFAVTGKEGRFITADVAEPGTRVGEARFNTNGVDLNRNFDCKWQPESTWRGRTVSAGTAPFSEPEAQAVRDWVLANNPDAAVFWHSQANNVYASECEAGVLPATLTLMSTYARAADYGEVPVFDAYPVTGDAEGWLASIGIPAVTVELESFRTSEFDRNLAGTQAIIDLYSN